MELTIETIESYGFNKIRTYKPDWDDVVVEIETPNGFLLEYMTVCNNDTCKTSGLEGLDGWVYLETKEELDEFLKKERDDILFEIGKKHDGFEIEDYI